MYNEYSEERKELAMKCADALGLKPLPGIMYHVGVVKSEIPISVSEGIPVCDNENSLLTMGFVYSYGPILTFIDSIGRSCVMPNNHRVKEELANCGYCICDEGKNTPELSGDVITDISEMNYLRGKYTLPPELAEQAMKLEGRESIKYDDSVSSRYNYDVFNPSLYPVKQYTSHDVDVAIEHLGLDNMEVRKFMALTGYASNCLYTNNRPNNITEFVEQAYGRDGHPALNHDKYYGNDEYPNGMYQQLSSQQQGKTM